MINLLTAMIILLTFSANAVAATLVETFAELKPSVGALYSLDSRGGDMRFLCTVTAVAHEGDRTVLLTAAHCVSKGNSYMVNFGSNQFRSVNVWKIPHYKISNDNSRAYGEPATDMAMFLMDGIDVPLVTMATNAVIQDGDAVVMVGFPLGLTKTSYTGTVAGTFDRPGSDESGYHILQIFGAPGSSGSAIVSVRTGEVISVLVQGRNARAGLPVILATPIDYRRWLEIVPTGLEVDDEAEPGTRSK